MRYHDKEVRGEGDELDSSRFAIAYYITILLICANTSFVLFNFRLVCRAALNAKPSGLSRKVLHCSWRGLHHNKLDRLMEHFSRRGADRPGAIG